VCPRTGINGKRREKDITLPETKSQPAACSPSAEGYIPDHSSNSNLNFCQCDSYGLDDRGSRVRFSAGAGNFSPHYRVQNSSEAHLASYPMGTRGAFPGGKAAGA
jgi:hypothetical protein